MEIDWFFDYLNTMNNRTNNDVEDEELCSNISIEVPLLNKNSDKVVTIDGAATKTYYEEASNGQVW